MRGSIERLLLGGAKKEVVREFISAKNTAYMVVFADVYHRTIIGYDELNELPQASVLFSNEMQMMVEARCEALALCVVNNGAFSRMARGFLAYDAVSIAEYHHYNFYEVLNSIIEDFQGGIWEDHHLN